MGNGVIVAPYNKVNLGSDEVGGQWEAQQPLPGFSGIVTVNAGIGIAAGVDPLRAVVIPIPSGAAILVRSINVQVLAGSVNQILFTIGNVAAFPQWFRVNAQMFASLGIIPVGEIVLAPNLFVDLSNISGTAFPGASGVPVNLQCIVSIDAVLLGEKNRGRIQTLA
jgi:hypothetical protein